MSIVKRHKAHLVLADGKVFTGEAFGFIGETWGEAVFNTSMSGYQEILTDPSYERQLLTFTYPHIGNVGINSEDVESSRVHAAGIIVKAPPRAYSNYRAEKSLEDYLNENKLVGISGIDTRELVLHLREHGAQMAIISSNGGKLDDLKERAHSLPSMEGMDLVKDVSVKTAYDWSEGSWHLGSGYAKGVVPDLSKAPTIVAIDCGIKINILRLFADLGFKLKVVPVTASAAEILSFKPVGVFLSNGPGDPATLGYLISTVEELLGKTPIFGICLGHQILGHAVGCPTYKLKFGHRGANHPVKNLITGKVEITVQNHGFASVKNKIRPGVQLTHLNLNDDTVEGIAVPDARAFSVQYHPEASPGPLDSHYLFQQFKDLCRNA